MAELSVGTKQHKAIPCSRRLASIDAQTAFQSSPHRYHAMRVSDLPSRYALLAPLLVSTFTRAQTAYQSIYTVDAFAEQPICVQNCFTAGYDNIHCYTDVLGSFLGCPNAPCATNFPAVDSCYCRGDLQSAANEWLGVCINELCSVGDNSVNLATAASIYSDYCQGRGFSAAPATATATTTKQSKSSTPTSALPGADPTSPGSVSTSGPDSTSAPAPSPTASSGTNTVVVVSACVGTVVVVIILAVAIFYWRRRRLRVRPRPSFDGSTQMESTKDWVSRQSDQSGSSNASQGGRPPSPMLSSAVRWS